MKIYYACRELHNFGDKIGPVIYRLIAGKDAKWGELSKPHYMVCGSILREANSNSIVMGAGYNGNNQRFEEEPKEIVFVRGYHTQNQLLQQGIKSEVFGDPGLCLPLLYQPNVRKKYEFGILPHYIDYGSIEVDRVFNKINPCQKVLKVIDEINKCEVIISSSLHGLIVAHSYGIPAVWVEFSDRVVGKGYKFRDYYTLSKIRNTPSPIDLRNKKITKETIRRTELFPSDQRLPDLSLSLPRKMIQVFKERWL